MLSYTTLCSMTPSDSISIRIVSSDSNHAGGSIAAPTPFGVPVRIRSPGASVHVWAMKATSSSQLKIRSAVLDLS